MPLTSLGGTLATHTSFLLPASVPGAKACALFGGQGPAPPQSALSKGALPGTLGRSGGCGAEVAGGAGSLVSLGLVPTALSRWRPSGSPFSGPGEVAGPLWRHHGELAACARTQIPPLPPTGLVSTDKPLNTVIPKQ